MAILRSMDGNFYEVPDEQVTKFKIPQEKLKEKLGTYAGSSQGPPGGGEGGPPLVNVHVYCNEHGAVRSVEVSPYHYHHHHHHHHGHHWYNWNNWHNWRNHWD
jgi:hypothetical protein